MHLSKNARPKSPETQSQQTKPAPLSADPACLSGRTVIPQPPSGGAPQRWGPSKPPKSPCQPRQSSKTRPHKTNIQTTKTDDHPANQPDHPSIKAQKTQTPARRNKSPRWPPPMNSLLDPAHEPVNAKNTGLIDFRDRHMTEGHNALPAKGNYVRGGSRSTRSLGSTSEGSCSKVSVGIGPLASAKPAFAELVRQ